MDRIGFDGRELAYVATALDQATVVAAAETAKVVERGAINIRDGARRRIRGLKHAPAYPSSIDYDLHVTGRGAVAEIGPNKSKRQGSLGNLLEYGSIKNPPHPHVAPAAEEEAPGFEKAMDALALKAIGL